MNFVKILFILLNSLFLIDGQNSNIQMTTYKIEPLQHPIPVLGEAPHWDIIKQSLYFVDIDSAVLYRYAYNENKTYETKIKDETFASFIIPIEDKPNQFAVGINLRVVIIEWDGISTTSNIKSTLFEVECDDKILKDNRFNDGKADPKGRLFSGTMPTFVNQRNMYKTNRTSNLYRYDNIKKIPILIKDNVGISNGLTWDINRNKFYYIDSIDANVKVYDYDFKTGNIKNPKVVIDFHQDPSFVPDGMTIDSNGYIYVATFGGSKVLKINPTTGNIDLEIKMPCEQISSVAFGGPNLDILYVTTASKGGKVSPAGQTFQITGLGVKGLEMYKFKL